MKEIRNFYIAKRTLPIIIKPFYIGLGELTKSEVDKKITSLSGIGEISLELFGDKSVYESKLKEYRDLGFCLY